MAKVLPPTSRRVATSMGLRPQRSPKWPKNNPPNGLAKNPTAKVAKDANVPAVASYLGKKSGPKISAEARP
jgi:hypothetical protein